MFEPIIDLLNQNCTGSIIAIIALIFTTCVAYYFYKKSIFIPKPVFCDLGVVIFNKPSELSNSITVSYKGHIIEELSKYRIIFWNSGKGILQWENIVDSSPLSIEFKNNVKILTAEIIKTTNLSNKFKIKIDPEFENKLLMEFDYLNENDGASIEVLIDSKYKYPEIKGDIKGVSQGIQNLGIIPRFKLDKKEFPLILRFIYSKLQNKKYSNVIILRIFLIVWFFISLIFAIILILPPYDAEPWFFVLSIIFTIILLIMSLLCISVFWMSRRKYPKLLDFDDDI